MEDIMELVKTKPFIVGTKKGTDRVQRGFTLSPEQDIAVNLFLEKQGISRSEFVQQAIAYALDNSPEDAE